MSGLDKTHKQGELLKQLETFFKDANKKIKIIENSINEHLKPILSSDINPGSENWICQVQFPKFEKLREAISKHITLTLHDHNNLEIDSKGSGIQRTVLLSLISYFSTREKNIIWYLDEPESFLHPLLQKKTFHKLREISRNSSVFYTTHSPNFVDINDLANTQVFTTMPKEKKYTRTPGKTFIEPNTRKKEYNSNYEKFEDIRLQLGIEANDGWLITPEVIVVEGEQDKNLLNALANIFGIPKVSIKVAGSADKMYGLLSYYNELSSSLDFNPKFHCLIDNDTSGRNVATKINNKKSKYLKDINCTCFFVKSYFEAPEGKDKNTNRTIEDIVYPDLFFSSINSVLKKQGYTKIDKSTFNNRTSVAFNKKSILEYCIEIIQHKNPRKEPIDENRLKGMLHVALVKNIERKAVKEKEISTYKNVERFIKKLFFEKEENK